MELVVVVVVVLQGTSGSDGPSGPPGERVSLVYDSLKHLYLLCVIATSIHQICFCQ